MASTQIIISSNGDFVRRSSFFTGRAAVRGGFGLLLTLLLAVTFATSAQAASVGLGTTDSFAVLAGSTVTNTGASVINGDIGLSPGTSVTGFPPGTQPSGVMHVNDAVALQAQTDLTTAYNDAAGHPSTSTISADLAGRTLIPGVYSSASSLGLTGDLTLDGQGNPGAVFIFQAGSTLITGSGSRVLLTGGAQSCNVFWQVGSSATIGTGTAFVGNILALTSIALTTGATLDGRALARNAAVTLDTSAVTKSTCAAGTTPTTPGTTPGGADEEVGASLPGTARLVTGPRTGPLRGPPSAGECVATPFTLRVSGRNIRQVKFSINGKSIGTVKAKAGRTVFKMRIDPRHQSFTAKRVTMRVSFTAASKTKTKILRLTYKRCQSVQPRFTG